MQPQIKLIENQPHEILSGIRSTQLQIHKHRSIVSTKKKIKHRVHLHILNNSLKRMPNSNREKIIIIHQNVAKNKMENRTGSNGCAHYPNNHLQLTKRTASLRQSNIHHKRRQGKELKNKRTFGRKIKFKGRKRAEILKKQEITGNERVNLTVDRMEAAMEMRICFPCFCSSSKRERERERKW